MIKASDYRIGNLLDYNGKIIKVTTLAIDFNGNQTIIASNENFLWHVSKFDGIKPIPLTEEWLFKFGFEIDDVWISKIKNIEYNRMIGIDLINNHIFLAQYDSHNKFRDVFISKCDYVHQLQNLYFEFNR
jgi:hypothetical protein